MMRVIQAEESLLTVTRVAAGNGLIKEPGRDKILAEWRQSAAMGTTSKKKRTTLGELIGNGIGLHVTHRGDNGDG